MASEKKMVKIATEPRYYEKFGVLPGAVALHEDGVHNDGRAGSYEWWYLDGHFDDGSNLVITFQNKFFVRPELPLTPLVSFDLNRPNGEKISKIYVGGPEEYSSSDMQCDVAIGKNRFKGDLSTYKIHIEVEDVTADVTLKGIVPAWRPGAGRILYGAEEQYEYGWIVGVPKGEVWAEVTCNGKKETYHGYGYHDHNWGDRSLLDLKHHGYWGRAEVDGYTFINAINYAPEEFGKEPFTVFMLAHHGCIIADDSAKVTFTQSDEFTDPETGKVIARKICYLYDDGGKKYRFSYEVKDIIYRLKVLEILPEEQRRKTMEKGLIAPAYLRFAGTVELEIMDGDEVIEKHSGKALWESMYFGNCEDF